MEYVNFFENISEATRRLGRTLITYRGDPYFVFCVSQHKSDNIIRMYLHSIQTPYDESPIRHLQGDAHYSDLDQWMRDNPSQEILLRKKINSKHFNRFRPFPLGMCNFHDTCFYLERTPTRNKEQGLTNSSFRVKTCIPFDSSPDILNFNSEAPVAIISREMYMTVKGIYPSFESCWENINNKEIVNTAIAFNREFCLVRGPCDIIFLCWKGNIVGYFKKADTLQLGSDYTYLLETIRSMNFIGEILQ